MTGVAVVGVHRGGTSAVAGVVNKLGAFMGDNLLPPSPFNPVGYFEDLNIVEFHTKVLGGSWANPVLNRTFRFVDEYRQLLAPFMKHDLWAIKDPRLCFTLPLLLRVAPDTKIVAVYRDPWNAARSLAKREEWPVEVALDVTLSHQLRMLENTVGEAPLRIRYIDLVTFTGDTVKKIADFVGVMPTKEAIMSVDSSLAHWEIDDAEELYDNI